MDTLKNIIRIIGIGIGLFITSLVMAVSYMLTGLAGLIRKVPVEVWATIVLMVIMFGVMIGKIWIG